MVHLITGHAGKAHVKASDEAKINKALYGNAEAAVDYGNNLAITLPSNNAVQIDTGLFYMQGRWIDIPAPVSVPFDNGVADMNRNDLVVFRYSMDPNTSVEVVDLVIKKGTSTSGTAEDPALETGLIDSGALVNEVPLYRIPISGINIGEPVKLFYTIQINIRDMQASILDTLEEVEANEEEKKIAGALALKELVEKLETSWNTVTLENGWTCIPGYDLHYFVDEHGSVHISGILDGTSATNAVFTVANADLQKVRGVYRMVWDRTNRNTAIIDIVDGKYWTLPVGAIYDISLVMTA